MLQQEGTGSAVGISLRYTVGSSLNPHPGASGARWDLDVGQDGPMASWSLLAFILESKAHKRLAFSNVDKHCRSSPVTMFSK